ncbi:MAG: hypothetical protein M3Y35_13690 [Actinomycetota bacterium]|nr:hypothetical protein [Actinomycetota bacterium]
MRLRYDERSVIVAFPRSGLWLKLLDVQSRGFNHRLDPDSDLQWTCEWADVKYAIVARRSIVFVRSQDARCRFKSIHRRKMSALREFLIEQNVPTRPVRTTLGHFLRR